MPVFLPVITAQAEQLAAASDGIIVATDPRNAAPPCYLILPRTVLPRTMRDGIRVETAVQIIAPGMGNADALVWLDGALEACWTALGKREANLVLYESPHTAAALLAYEIVYQTDYEQQKG